LDELLLKRHISAPEKNDPLPILIYRNSLINDKDLLVFKKKWVLIEIYKIGLDINLT